MLQDSPEGRLWLESQTGASDLLPPGFESETTGQQENPAPESGSSSGAQLPQSGVGADFMSDRLYDGTRFRTFNVIDHFYREGLAIEGGHVADGPTSDPCPGTAQRRTRTPGEDSS